MKRTWEGDRDPLSALRSGDAALFEDFVRSETAAFMGFFLRMGASPHEAEDLVQELFLKLFQHAQTYQSEGKFVAFAFRVARNAWIDRLRRQHVRARGAADGAEGADEVAALRAVGPDPVDVASEREEHAALGRAWRGLAEPHRVVFELGALQERSYQEISETLAIPVGTVKSRMFYALRKLRAALSSERVQQ